MKSIASRIACFYSSIFFCESRSKRRWKDGAARLVRRSRGWNAGTSAQEQLCLGKWSKVGIQLTFQQSSTVTHKIRIENESKKKI